MKVVILAGGLGTRSEDPTKPKILQEVAPDITLLDLHLENASVAKLVDVVFLLGHGSEEVMLAIKLRASRWPNLRIETFVDTETKGPWPSLSAYFRDLKLTSRLHGEKFLIILGDTAMAMPLGSIVDQAEKQGKSLVFGVHPNLHSFDSDSVVLNAFGELTQILLKGDQLKAKNIPGIQVSLTGLIYFSAPEGMNLNIQEPDHIRGLLAQVNDIERVGFLMVSGYSSDSGTPARLSRIRDDYLNGSLQRRGAKLRPAIFMDRDGTLFSDRGTGRNSFHRDEIAPSLVAMIAQANSHGIPIFLISNQPGIAKGQIDLDDLTKLQGEIFGSLERAGVFFDDFRFCPHHPEYGFPGERPEFKISCSCRKPNPGMVTDLQKVHEIDLESSFIIGDSAADRGAALRSGTKFIECSHDGRTGLSTVDALKRAITEILDED